MRQKTFVLTGLLIITSSAHGFAQPADTARYLTPPKAVIDAFDAAPLPQVILSPTKQVLALTYRKAYPSIVELSQPMLRLAGSRVNPRNNGPHRAGQIHAISLKNIEGGAEVKVVTPPQASITNVQFSPDGSHLSFLNRKADRIELWVANTATGRTKLVSGLDRLNATTGDPCEWLRDNVTMTCELVPPGRGPAPVEPQVPLGPNVQETSGKASPAATYEDMLKTAHDDALFEYYFTSQFATFNVVSGARTLIGRPAIFSSVTASPSGEYFVVARIKRPFSHLIPMNGFPQDVEIWNRRGEVARQIADLPSRCLLYTSPSPRD